MVQVDISSLMSPKLNWLTVIYKLIWEGEFIVKQQTNSISSLNVFFCKSTLIVIILMRGQFKEKVSQITRPRMEKPIIFVVISLNVLMIVMIVVHPHHVGWPRVQCFTLHKQASLKQMCFCYGQMLLTNFAVR